jgi:tRNA A37 methylthiotransferase MiaB
LRIVIRTFLNRYTLQNKICNTLNLPLDSSQDQVLEGQKT